MDKNMTDVKLVSEALRRIIEPMIDQRLSAVLDSAYFFSCEADKYKGSNRSIEYLMADSECKGILRGAALALGIDIDTMISVYNNFVTELEIAKHKKEEEK